MAAKKNNGNAQTSVVKKITKLDLETYNIDNSKASNNGMFTRLPKIELIESLKAIRRDIVRLSESDIFIKDLELGNIKVLQNKIVLCGFNNFSISMDREFNKLSNNIKVNEFFGSKGISLEDSSLDSFVVGKKIYTKFLESDEDYIEDYYDRVLTDNESIKEYVKRL